MDDFAWTAKKLVVQEPLVIILSKFASFSGFMPL